jgi:hypothetical protein
MSTFEFFIEDDRYTVPSFELVQARSPERARQLAAARLHASLHHLSVEVRTASERLFFLSRTEVPRGAGAAQRSAV